MLTSQADGDGASACSCRDHSRKSNNHRRQVQSAEFFIKTLSGNHVYIMYITMYICPEVCLRLLLLWQFLSCLLSDFAALMNNWNQTLNTKINKKKTRHATKMNHRFKKKKTKIIWNLLLCFSQKEKSSLRSLAVLGVFSELTAGGHTVFTHSHTLQPAPHGSHRPHFNRSHTRTVPEHFHWASLCVVHSLSTSRNLSWRTFTLVCPDTKRNRKCKDTG